jgi:hypothetical protein
LKTPRKDNSDAVPDVPLAAAGSASTFIARIFLDDATVVRFQSTKKPAIAGQPFYDLSVSVGFDAEWRPEEDEDGHWCEKVTLPQSDCPQARAE